MNEKELWEKYKTAGSELKKMKKYVYYQKVNQQGELLAVDEMNLWEWMDKQRSSEKNTFKFVRLVDLDNNPTIFSSSPTTTPQIEEDPLQCPLCGMVAKSKAGLVAHKNKRHSV